jgi:hypothetical protein
VSLGTDKVDYIFYILQVYLKILLFLENNLKKIKPFSKRPKGLKLASCPYWTRSELFVGVKL